MINELLGYCECPCGHKEQVLIEQQDEATGAAVEVWDNEASSIAMQEHVTTCNVWRSVVGLPPAHEVQTYAECLSEIERLKA